MKSFLFLFLSSIVILSCGSNNADEPIDETDTVTMNYSWQASLNDSTGKLEMKKAEAIGLDSLTLVSIVAFINDSDSSVHLDIVKTSNDTVYLKIPDATYLTQRMGSTGADMYLAAAVYNLTEISGIHYVNLDFEEGDHAQPGTFNRDSFKDE